MNDCWFQCSYSPSCSDGRISRHTCHKYSSDVSQLCIWPHILDKEHMDQAFFQLVSKMVHLFSLSCVQDPCTLWRGKRWKTPRTAWTVLGTSHRHIYLYNKTSIEIHHRLSFPLLTWEDKYHICNECSKHHEQEGKHCLTTSLDFLHWLFEVATWNVCWLYI